MSAKMATMAPPALNPPAILLTMTLYLQGPVPGPGAESSEPRYKYCHGRDFYTEVLNLSPGITCLVDWVNLRFAMDVLARLDALKPDDYNRILERVIRRVTDDLFNGRKQRTRHRRVAVPDELAVDFDRAKRSNKPMRDLLMDRALREELDRIQVADEVVERSRRGRDGLPHATKPQRGR